MSVADGGGERGEFGGMREECSGATQGSGHGRTLGVSMGRTVNV